MKRLLLVLLLLFPLLILSACEPQVYSGKIILEGKHTLDTVDGDLVMLGGQIMLKEGSRVTGSVYLLSGELKVDGAIGGDLTMLTGTLTLGRHAQVHGDLKIGSGTVNRSPTVTIGGKVTSETGMAVPLSPGWWNDQSVGGQFLWFLARTVLLAALALLLVRCVPQPVVRISTAAVKHPVISGALGLLTFVVSLSLLVFMAFTIILLPVTLLGLVLLGAAIISGWIALGLAVGQHLTRWLKWRMQAAPVAFLGTLLLMVALTGLGFIPIAGAIASLLSAAIGLGAVLLTRFGRRTYMPVTDAVPLSGEQQKPSTDTALR